MAKACEFRVASHKDTHSRLELRHKHFHRRIIRNNDHHRPPSQPFLLQLAPVLSIGHEQLISLFAGEQLGMVSNASGLKCN